MNYRIKYTLIYGLWGCLPSFLIGAVVAGTFLAMATLFIADSGKSIDLVAPVGYVLGGIVFIIGLVSAVRYGYAVGMKKEQDPKMKFPTQKLIVSAIVMIALAFFWLINA